MKTSNTKKGHLKLVKKTRKRKEKVKPEHYEIKSVTLTTSDLAKATGMSGGFFRDLVEFPYRGYVIPPYHMKGNRIEYFAWDVEEYLINHWGIKVTNPFPKPDKKLIKSDDIKSDDIKSETTEDSNSDDLIINRVKRIKGSRLLEPSDSDQTCRFINHQSTGGNDFFISIPLFRQALKYKNEYPTTIELEDEDDNIVARMDIKKFQEKLQSERVDVKTGKDGGEYLTITKNWKFK